MKTVLRALLVAGFTALTFGAGQPLWADGNGDALPDMPDLPVLEPQALGAGGACTTPPKASLATLPPALLMLTVTAPCQADTAVRITHGALGFAGLLDAEGRFTATIPALSDPARVTVTAGDAAPVDLTRPVPDLATVSRLALSVRGQTGLHLAADLPGTTPRRVDGDAPGLPTLGQGGFLTRLGDPSLPAPQLAEVITLPAARAARLSVVADVTPDNCDRDLLAMVLMAEPAAAPAAGAISLSMPGCDAVGEQLVISDDPLRRLLRVSATP